MQERGMEEGGEREEGMRREEGERRKGTGKGRHAIPILVCFRGWWMVDRQLTAGRLNCPSVQTYFT